MTAENNPGTNQQTELSAGLKLSANSQTPAEPQAKIHVALQQIPFLPPIDFFQDLSKKDTDRNNLYERLELRKGLTINKIQPEGEDWIVSKTFKNAFDWKTDSPPNWKVPRKNGYWTVDILKSSENRELKKIFSDYTSNQNFSLFALDSKSSNKSFESSSLNATDKSYLLAEYVIPKLILSLDLESIQLDQIFIHKVNNAVEKQKNNEWLFFVKLNDILSEYGYFVPLKFTIGGKISAEREVNSQISSNSKQYKSFESSFAAKLNLFNFQAPEVSSTVKTSGNTDSNRNTFSEEGIELEYHGGIGSALTSPNEWIASLNSYLAWQVIKYSDFVPIIYFFEKELRDKVIRAFIKYSYYPYTDKPLILNGIDYASRTLDLINRENLSPSTEDSHLEDEILELIDTEYEISELIDTIDELSMEIDKIDTDESPPISLAPAPMAGISGPSEATTTTNTSPQNSPSMPTADQEKQKKKETLNEKKQLLVENQKKQLLGLLSFPVTGSDQTDSSPQ